MQPKEDQRLIRFLGGKTSYYVIGLVCLLCVMVWLLTKISFLFQPLGVIISTILPPMVFALVLYYVLNPLIDRLSQKIPRTWSLIITYVLIIGLLVLGGFLLVPVLKNQTEDLIKQLPGLFDGFQATLKNFLKGTPFADSINQALNSLDSVTDHLTKFITDNWQDGAKGLGNLFSAVSTAAITLFTGPLIAFFLLKDPKKFYRALIGIVPPRFRKDFNELVKIADQQIGAFLKGQIVSSLILGVMYRIVFLLIGLKFATVLALAAGLLCIVPYIGPFVAFFPGLFIAFQDSTFMVIKFVVAWFVIQLLHGDLVVPRVMGDRLKIHPITILVVLLVMGDLLGLVGVIFGIPIYALIKMLTIFSFRKFKQRYNRYFSKDGKYRKTNFSEEDYL